MIRVIRKTGFLVAALTLTACGKVGDLEPSTGQSLPPTAYGENGEQSAEKLMTPSVQARPKRSDDVVSRSTPRADDPFDFAPGQPVPPLPGTEEDNNKPKTEAKPE